MPDSMKASIEALHSAGPRFRSTRWSVVAASAARDEHGRQALEQLARDYWSPIHAYLRRSGQTTVEAQETTQAFFAWLIHSEAYAHADPRRGKFRTFLLGLLHHFLSAEQRKASRQKRGGGVEMVPLSEFVAGEQVIDMAPADSGLRDEEREFDRDWARVLVERALGLLEEEYQAAGRGEVYRELLPFLEGGTALPTQADAAARLGVGLETLRSHLSRLRARYRLHLRAEVSRTILREAEVEDELRYLCRVLIASA